MYSFSKSDRLYGNKNIESLFKEGRSMKAGIIKAIYQSFENDIQKIKVVMIVPKRNIKFAHDRNRIKRQMREAWRLKKHKLYSNPDSKKITLHLGLLFLGKSLPDYSEIESKIDMVINQIADNVQANTSSSSNWAY